MTFVAFSVTTTVSPSGLNSTCAGPEALVLSGRAGSQERHQVAAPAEPEAAELPAPPAFTT